MAVTDATGYAHPDYAASFAEFATPRELPASGGWILERQIAGSGLRDAMGCYPIFVCRDWRRLGEDLDAIADDLVTLTLVTDPFGTASMDELAGSFDVVRHFKDHYVVDLREPMAERLPRRHRRNLAKASQRVEVTVCEEPIRLLDEWLSLFGVLVERHGITGMRAFSHDAFALQLEVPGLVMLEARADDELVGLHLWYIHDAVAYGHLGATSDLGYELMAAYSLYGYAVEHLRTRVRWLDLGAAAGLSRQGGRDGLTAFKQGWATGTRPAYLCGRIFHPQRYSELSAAATDDGPYFPAYRLGELGDRVSDRTVE